jgi:hypothetical protein
MTSVDVASYVEASRQRQGLPPKVEDAAALARAVALLLAGKGGTG